MAMKKKTKLPSVERKCSKVFRVAPHQSVVVGGVCVGGCKNEALPRLVYCWEHADREAMAMVIREMDAESVGIPVTLIPKAKVRA